MSQCQNINYLKLYKKYFFVLCEFKKERERKTLLYPFAMISGKPSSLSPSSSNSSSNSTSLLACPDDVILMILEHPSNSILIHKKEIIRLSCTCKRLSEVIKRVCRRDIELDCDYLRKRDDLIEKYSANFSIINPYYYYIHSFQFEQYKFYDHFTLGYDDRVNYDDLVYCKARSLKVYGQHHRLTSNDLPMLPNNLETLHLNTVYFRRLPMHLSKLSNLRAIIIEHAYCLEDISCLSFCSSLQDLKLYECPNIKFEGLSDSKNEFQSLEMLEITKNTQLKDCMSLRGLSHLKKLRLYCNTNLISLSGLETMTSLKMIIIDGSAQVTRLEPLSKLPMLHTLKLHRLYNIQDLSPLTQCSGLHELELIHCRGIGGCTQIGLIPNLRKVGIMDMHHFNLAGLSKAKDIELVRMEDIELLDTLSELLKLSSLKELHLVRMGKVKKSVRNKLEEMPTLEAFIYENNK